MVAWDALLLCAFLQGISKLSPREKQAMSAMLREEGFETGNSSSGEKEVESDYPALPELNIDPNAITISGISSGADFVVNLHVAHSSVLKGVGVFAGQAYHCAVTRFRRDELVPPSPSVPVCEGCPENTTLSYDHCKQHPEWVEIDALVDYAKNQSALGTIDNVSNIAGHPIYLYRGTHDTCYKTGAEAMTLTFYSRLTLDRGNNNRIAIEGSVGSNHAQPTADYGAPCGGKGDKRFSYIEKCGYDGAGAVLQHMYGNNLTQPQQQSAENLITFDQSAYFINATHPELKSPALPSDGSAGLSRTAYAYVPSRCRKQTDGSTIRADQPCKLHLYHHGCGGPWGSTFYEGVTHHGGFNEWAEANGIVVIYPAMAKWGHTGQSRGGCWDGYAQTGSDYGLKSGAQISVVRNIIRKVAGV